MAHPSHSQLGRLPITPVLGRSDPINLRPREYAPVTAIPAGIWNVSGGRGCVRMPRRIRPIEDSAGVRRFRVRQEPGRPAGVPLR